MLAAIAILMAHLSTKPNIVLMLVDDLGWKDLGYSGSDLYMTPNIDRLSSQGVRFTHAYSAHPVCSPTRAALMTGKDPVRVGITDWIPGDRPTNKPLRQPDIPNQLPLNEVTLAESLKQLGYRTIHIGKWHLGGDGNRPTDQGFDVNIGGSHIGQPGSYFFPFGVNVNPSLDRGETGEYLTDRLTTEALRLVDETKDRPYFLYFAQYAVHTPIQAKGEDVSRFADAANSSQQHKNAKYAAMIWNLDQNVGRLVERLSENTVFIFISDNGGLSPITDNAPLRASKGYTYEGGIRTPAFCYWPGRIKPGTLVDERVITMDFTATILDLAGSRKKAADGKSLWGAMLGKPYQAGRPFIWHYPQYHSSGQTPTSAMRDGDWKVVHYYEGDRNELYNLKSDPNESNGLAIREPRRAFDMWRKLKRRLDAMGAKFPEVK